VPTAEWRILFVLVVLVVLAQEVGRRGVGRERPHDLLGGPGRSGMLGDVEVEDAPPMVGAFPGLDSPG
jgi:hypothetical protein